MGWASTLVCHHHRVIRLPLRFTSRLLRARHGPAPPLVPFPSHPQVGSTTHCVWSGYRLRCSRAWCAPQREHRDFLTEEENGRPQEGGETKSTEKSSFLPPSVGHSNLNVEGGEHDQASLVKLVVFWIFAAVAFGVGLGVKDGVDKASEFFAGYILEKSLSVDNLFVFVLIFKYFKVPVSYQSRVLSYGIAGAVVFRAIMILLGIATLKRFETVNLLLAAILIYSSYKLFVAEEEETDLSNNFIVKTCQKFIPITSYYDSDRFITIQDGIQKATPLLLTLAVIELSDIAFAVDSIPAVFGVTRDPFIVFTSNIFAILGLRSLYVLISESMGELEYLQPAIGVVLGFIGSKMILDFFGYHVSTDVSLGIVATTLGSGLLLSHFKKSDG
uniref:Putative membrane protein STKORF319 n=2 Tax=Anthurium amnicola TaxID=1678845 RepID=A0A1D1ZIB7_9ARAE